MDQAELKLATGGWRSTTINEALRLGRTLTYRCSECWGQVRAHTAAADGINSAHFERRERDAGCSLIPAHFPLRRSHVRLIIVDAHQAEGVGAERSPI